jgi:hypothetical protein
MVQIESSSSKVGHSAEYAATVDLKFQTVANGRLNSLIGSREGCFFLSSYFRCVYPPSTRSLVGSLSVDDNASQRSKLACGQTDSNRRARHFELSLTSRAPRGRAEECSHLWDCVRVVRVVSSRQGLFC